MAKRRRYHPAVAEDLSRAVAHYAEISPELGNRFRTAIKETLDSVFTRPDTHGRLCEEYRAAIAVRFPYLIVYEQKDETICVLGVYHAASDPAKWLDRTN